MFQFARAVAVAAVAVSAVSGATIVNAQSSETKIKFALDWRFEGPAAPYFVAIDKGYYKDEGLDVTIDAGNGSVEAINRVAIGRLRHGLWRHQQPRQIPRQQGQRRRQGRDDGL